MDATLGLESRATHTLAFDLKNQNPQSNSFSKLVQIWSKYRSGPVNSVNMHVVRVDTDIMGFNFRDRARRLFIDTNRFRLDSALSDCLRLRISAVCLLLAMLPFTGVGCSLGPRTIHNDRLLYNEAVKTTSEQQLLLNIVRMRYTDSPSSLAISSIADQREITGSIGIVPFYTSAGAGDVGSYRGSIWPSAGLAGVTRPTLSFTPLDDQEFTRRLFTPISLEGTAYLSKTTWPISVVFRLYLENLNWVSNAETASGPTPCASPEYADFLAGISALQRLQDRKLIAIFSEPREKVMSVGRGEQNEQLRVALDAINEGYQLQTNPDGTWKLVKEKNQPVLRLGDIASDDEDLAIFCTAFRLDPSLRTFDLTADGVDPFLIGTPSIGLDKLDLETRSLLQVLYFVSHGVDVPAVHLASRLAPTTFEASGQAFDWRQVMQGLFQVRHVRSRKPPTCAQIAIKYQDYWFYIDERDRETKSTFSLLLEVSRLELNTPSSTAPLLTLPLGG